MTNRMLSLYVLIQGSVECKRDLDRVSKELLDVKEENESFKRLLGRDSAAISIVSLCSAIVYVRPFRARHAWL